MRKALDDNLNLEQLFSRCKQMDPNIMIRIYFDPDISLFHINYLDTMEFFLPPTASFIGQCRAEKVRLTIEFFIGRAVRSFTKPVE